MLACLVGQTDRRSLPEPADAEEAIAVCGGAISRAPDDVARSIFERSQKIWQKRLAQLPN